MKNKSNAAVSACALLLSAIVIAAVVAFTVIGTFAASNSLIATDYINLRKSASASASVLKTLSPNTSVTLLSNSTNGWAYVSVDTYKGYCSTSYLSLASGSSAKMTGKTTTAVNLRSGKGTSYSVVLTVPGTATVTVLDNTDESWAKVTYSGKQGYLSKEYLTVMFTLSAQSTTVAPTAPMTVHSVTSANSFSFRNADVSSLPSWYSKSLSASLLPNNDVSNSKIMLDKSALSLDIGAKYQLTALSMQGFANSIKYSTSNSSIATVSDNGIVKAMGSGKAVITAQSLIDNTTALCSISVSTSYAPTEPATQKPTEKPTVAPTSPPPTAKPTVAPTSPPPTAKPTVAPTSPPPTAKPTVPPTSPPATTVAETLSLSASSATVYTGNYYQLIAKSNVSVSWSTSNSSVATVSSGIVTTKASGTVTITAKTSTKTATCKITVKAPTKTVNISHTTASVVAGKTFFAKSSTSSVSWSSSNTSVATVKNGYILGVSKGKAVITASVSGGAKTCLVTVGAAAPVRFAYTSPNCAAKNSTVTFKAITDKTRSDVKFEVVSPSGTKSTVSAASKTADGSTYVWKGTLKLTSAGTYNVTAYSKLSGTWSTCADAKTTAFVTSTTNSTTTICAERRASDDIIDLIAAYEGYMSSVYDDYITGDPTLGYGRLVYSGQTFYNSLTKNEAYAYLVQTVNNDGYSSKVNSFLVGNSVKFNQQQFDTLVCFVYSTGTGVLTNDDELKSALLNCSSGSSTSITSYYINGSYVRIRSGPGTDHSILDELDYGTVVTILSTSNSEWYYVSLSDGTKGYVCSDYISTKTSGSGLDLNYVKKQTLINKMCQYHHAGGGCVRGLLYRRVDEMEVFFYRDYDRNYGEYNYNISFTCANDSSFHT